MSFISKCSAGLIMVTAAAASGISPVSAGTPQQALNKTVHVSFSAAVSVISPAGKRINTTTTSNHEIYISSAGRLFGRGSYAAPGARTGGDAAPGATRNNLGEVRALRFEGSKLVGDAAYQGGARHMTITFDPAFTSCDVSVLFGKSGGIVQRKGPDGQVYTVESITLSNHSCSVQAGNGLQ
jgi:hypothetical protein